MTSKENRPGGNGAAQQASCGGRSHYIATDRRRRDAAHRLPRRDCCTTSDPWLCRCYDPPLTDRTVDGYAEAVRHLATLGLTPFPFRPELRIMYRRGGHDRELAMRVAEKWPVAA